MNEIKQDNIAETAIKSFEINTGSAEPSAAASADVASADAASADVASADVATRDSMWSSDASCIPSLQLMMCHVCDRHQLCTAQPQPQPPPPQSRLRKQNET